MISESEYERVDLPLLQQQHGITIKEDDTRTASCISGIFNLTNTIVGSGIMSLPYVIKILGVVPGVLLIILSGFLTNYSINILLRFSENGRVYSYGQLLNDAFGRTGEMILQISVVSSNTGGCIVYLIIIADVISGSSSSLNHHSGVLEEWFGIHWWTGRVFVLVFMTVFLLVPSVWRKRIDSMRHTSAIAVGSAVFFILIVIWLTVYKLATGTVNKPALYPSIDNLSSVWNLFTAVPVIVSAYLCHFNVHTIQSELRDASQMPAIVNSSLIFCGIIYATTGLFGLLLFGDATATNVLSNFDIDLGVPYSSLLDTLVRLSYSIHILLVLPVNFYALRMNFDGLIFNSSVIPLSSDDRRFAFTSLSLLLLILLGAIFIPNIWIAAQFIGAPTGALISFILPASIALRDCPKIATTREKIISWVLIILSVFSTLVAVYSSVVSLL